MFEPPVLGDHLAEKVYWRDIAPGVFGTSLLTPSQCSQLLDTIEGLTARPGTETAAPNTLHEYGTVLADKALNCWISELIARELRGAVQQLFKELPHYRFSDHYTFLASYGNEGDSDLSLHVDASHVTLNICLLNNAQGADLVFTGSRCREHLDDRPDQHPGIVPFTAGDALLHLGSQRHFVTPLERGDRKNLVTWYRLEEECFDHSNGWIKARCRACKR